MMFTEKLVNGRKKMTKARRARIFGIYGKYCYCCGVFQGDSVGRKLQIDHMVPLMLGGSEEDENMRPICDPCHERKTAQENKIRGKIQRLSGKTKGRAKKSWPKKQSRWPKGRKIQSRGFQKREAASRI